MRRVQYRAGLAKVPTLCALRVQRVVEHDASQSRSFLLPVKPLAFHPRCTERENPFPDSVERSAESECWQVAKPFAIRTTHCLESLLYNNVIVT